MGESGNIIISFNNEWLCILSESAYYSYIPLTQARWPSKICLKFKSRLIYIYFVITNKQLHIHVTLDFVPSATGIQWRQEVGMLLLHSL